MNFSHPGYSPFPILESSGSLSKKSRKREHSKTERRRKPWLLSWALSGCSGEWASHPPLFLCIYFRVGSKGNWRDSMIVVIPCGQHRNPCHFICVLSSFIDSLFSTYLCTSTVLSLLTQGWYSSGRDKQWPAQQVNTRCSVWHALRPLLAEDSVIRMLFWDNMVRKGLSGVEYIWAETWMGWRWKWRDCVREGWCRLRWQHVWVSWRPLSMPE